MLKSLLEVCQEWGRGGTWRILRFPDRMWVGQVHSWSHGWPYFPLRKLPWKFHFDIFIRHLSRMEGHSSWYLADIEGSWWDTWMTGSSLISLMTKFDTKKDTLKVLCQYFHWKCVKKGVLYGGTWRTLKVPDRRFRDRVMHDIMDVLGGPRGSYPESFV